MGKQYTTAPILVNSNGDPIPQYLDITDKTDSPQGTFKPLTNETIQKVQLTGSNVVQVTDFDKLQQDVKNTNLKLEELITNQRLYINVMNSDKLIFGVYWDKSSNPTLARTDSAEGLVANVGKDGELVRNDFDHMPIWGEMGEEQDAYGNVFIRIPKFYIQKVEGSNFRLIRVSKTRYPGFYLPWVFWDFENNKELDYFLFGKYKASLDSTNKLESKPDKYPLINRNIVQFRDYARANNNLEIGLKGYQQLDIHAYDVLQTLFRIEFATLHSQSILQGFTSGQYSGSHVATVSETLTNRIIVANSTADQFRVGQTISVGTSLGGNEIFYVRTIEAIEVYDNDNKSIVFDGEPVDIEVGNFVYNTGWKNGFSRDIASSSGFIGANDGKYPCSYRGIESPWGDIWQFVDGVNITDNQAWVAKNADEYVSNVFTAPYEKLGYINSVENGYVIEMGYDPTYPFAEFPTKIGGGSSTYYADYYYQTSGQRIALVGGYWGDGSNAGLSSWHLSASSSYSSVLIGGRLLKKPL